MEVRILRRQEKSIRAIAQELGISRNSVRKYLRSEIEPAYSARPERPGKLEALQTYLQERVKAAHPATLPATVLFRELQERGYTGSLSLLRMHLRESRPVMPSEPLVRFETALGRQDGLGGVPQGARPPGRLRRDTGLQPGQLCGVRH